MRRLPIVERATSYLSSESAGFWSVGPCVAVFCGFGGCSCARASLAAYHGLCGVKGAPHEGLGPADCHDARICKDFASEDLTQGQPGGLAEGSTKMMLTVQV